MTKRAVSGHGGCWLSPGDATDLLGISLRGAIDSRSWCCDSLPNKGPVVDL